MRLQKYPLPDITDKNDYITQILLLHSYIIRTLFLSVTIPALLDKQTIPFIESLINQGNKHYKEIIKQIEDIDENKLKKSPYYNNYISERNSFEEIINGQW